MTIGAKARRFAFWFLSIAVALVSWRFFVLGIEAAFPNMVHQLKPPRLMFIVHILASPVALLIVPFQFSPKFRGRHPGLHRWLGRIYCVAVLLGGISGLIIGFNAGGGWVARTGFVVLSVVWLGATAWAYLLARAGRFADHRAWMLRSASLTFAAVMLRLWLAGQLVAGVPFEIAYPIVAWVSWVLNLAVAEYIVRRAPAVLRTGQAIAPGGM